MEGLTFPEIPATPELVDVFCLVALLTAPFLVATYGIKSAHGFKKWILSKVRRQYGLQGERHVEREFLY